MTVFITSPFGLIFARWFPGSPVEPSVRKVGDWPVWCHCCISSLQQCLTHSRRTKNVLREQTMNMELPLGVTSLQRYHVGIFVMDVSMEATKTTVEAGGGSVERRIRRSSSAGSVK